VTRSEITIAGVGRGGSNPFGDTMTKWRVEDIGRSPLRVVVVLARRFVRRE
jgi:hypothetical protein